MRLNIRKAGVEYLVDKQADDNLPLNVVWLCGGTTADITPAQPVKFNMDEAYEKIKKHNVEIRVRSQMVLIFVYMKMDVSLFNGGRMLIKNVTDKDVSLRAYREILKTIDINL